MLSAWESNGWLQRIRRVGEEIDRLLAVADRSLADAAIPGLSFDARVGFCTRGRNRLGCGSARRGRVSREQGTSP